MINFAYVVMGLCVITFICRWRKLKDAEHILMVVTSVLGAIFVLGITIFLAYNYKNTVSPNTYYKIYLNDVNI